MHYIPRIIFKWQIKRNRRSVERCQFPLRPAYAMTCRKPQGKTTEKVALDLTSAAFSHGRACSCGSRAKAGNHYQTVRLDPAM